jgi:glycosyltransferase involved in cell wall biosynthesis
MNILLLTSTFPSDKHDTNHHLFQIDFIDMLSKADHSVTVLTHARNEIHEKIREDMDIVWFPWRRVPGRLAEIDFFRAGNILAMLSLIYNGVKHVKKIIEQKRIDLVICLWVIPSGLYIYFNSLLRLIKVPYFLWALGSDINKYQQNLLIRWLLRKIIQRSARIFADGFELCNTINAISGRDCEFLPTFRRINRDMGLDVDNKFISTPSFPLVGNPPEEGLRTSRSDKCGNDPYGLHSKCDRVSFLYVGRHAKVKGIDILIQAVISLEKRKPPREYCVIIVGEGELTSQMMSMVKENNLDNRVKFEGKISDAHLIELYSQTDCVVIPSRSESIPLVLSEALQFNKPMIVTNVGDMGLLGKRYRVARVVEKENAEAFANAMKDFMEKPFPLDPEKRNELLSLLMMENSAQKILNIIAQLESK